MATVNFNVGGKQFTISKRHILKSTKLDYLDGLRISDEPIFLDYNYEAFSVVLDYLRHDQFLVPPNVDGNLVELIIDELGIIISHSQRQILVKSGIDFQKLMQVPPSNETTAELPPQYTPCTTTSSPSVEVKKPNSNSGTIIDQLFIAVEQKVAELIFSTLYPRISSQAQQGAFRTTYILLPYGARNGVMTSQFESSKFVERVYLQETQDRFLTQPEVLDHFADALREKVGVPVTFTNRNVSVRKENEFGILETASFSALVIEFELGRHYV